MNFLTPEKALIFRISHIDNVAWALEHGLHSRKSGKFDPNFREIGNPELISKRAGRQVPIPPGGTLSDYVPFYFTPFSPMLLNIKTGYAGMKQVAMKDIVFLISSLHRVQEEEVSFVFTDRHAYLMAAEYSNDLNELSRIDWGLLQKRDFKKDAEDPGKFERYQAEALIHQHLPVSALAGLACHGNAEKERVETILKKLGKTLKVVVKPNLYF
jgi:hypothetical protein